MKQTLILLLCFTACFSSSLFKWKLNVKNDKLDSNAVVLVPGIFTKVTFVLENEGDQDFDDQDNQYTFQLVPENDNIAIVGDAILLTPTSSLQASGYIGLKCGHTLSDSSFELKFNVKGVTDKNGKSATGQATLDFGVNTVKISNEKAKVDLDLVMNQIPAESYTVMKVNQEPYNIETLELKAESDSDDLTTSEITLKKYDGEREEYSPDNSVNRGILFDFKLLVKNAYEQLTKTSFNLNLSVKNEELQKCFELVKKTFKIDVLQQKVAELKDNIKQAIKYTLENISKKKDALSNLVFRLNVPVAPVKISCEIRLNSSFSTDEEILANAHASADVQYYNDILTSKGQVDLKLGQLNANAEYYTKCVFDTTAVKETANKIAVTIGNFINADILKRLKPSYDPYRRPQCVKVEFSSAVATSLTTVIERYCSWVMTKGESLLVRLFSDSVCEVGDVKVSLLSDNYAYICVHASPVLKTYNTTSLEEGQRFDKSFDEFINGIQDAQKTLNKWGLSSKVKSVTKYYDQKPDTALFEYKVDDSDWLVAFNKDIKFTVTSNNDFPVQCYYNSILTYDLNKKFGLLENKVSVTLNKGEAKTFTTKIPKDDFVTGRSYPLYLECYSLPGSSVRYETTGVFNPFTYYYDKSTDTATPLPNTPTTVDCTAKANKYHPRCIKQKVESIVEQLKTDIPQFIQDIETKVEEFKAIAKDAQKKILLQLNETLTKAVADAKTNFKNFVEKATETAKYLASLDCSIYASGSKSEDGETIKAGLYVECRETKREILSQIIPTIKEKLACSNVVQTITSGLSDDPEQNLKYVLFLLSEVTSSPDAFKNGTTEVLLDVERCLTEKYNEYWPKVEQYLNNTKNYVQESIDAVRKDATTLIMQTLANLVNALHFDEIDGYINETVKKVQDTGLMLYDKAKEVYKQIKDVTSQLGQYGSGFYNISGSLSLDVNVKNGQLDGSTDAELYVADIEDRGIKLLLHSNYMLREYGGNAVHSLVFDSPLVSVKGGSEVKDNTLNTFVDVSVYDENGNEKAVKSISVENFRPSVLFNKKFYKDLKNCLYYDEEKEVLSSDGVETDPDFQYDGESYIKCTSKHLTSFTLSSSEGTSSGGIAWWAVVLIVLLVLVVLAGLAVGVIMIRKKTSSKLSGNDVMKVDTPIMN